MGCASSSPAPPPHGQVKKPKAGRAGCSFDALAAPPITTFYYSHDALDGPPIDPIAPDLDDDKGSGDIKQDFGKKTEFKL